VALMFLVHSSNKDKGNWGFNTDGLKTVQRNGALLAGVASYNGWPTSFPGASMFVVDSVELRQVFLRDRRFFPLHCHSTCSLPHSPISSVSHLCYKNVAFDNGLK
jgi:hypothetical protein